METEYFNYIKPEHVDDEMLEIERRMASLGFDLVNTGGNCLAYSRRDSLDREAGGETGFTLVTIEDDAAEPRRFADPVVVGEYDLGGELIGEETRYASLADFFRREFAAETVPLTLEQFRATRVEVDDLRSHPCAGDAELWHDEPVRGHLYDGGSMWIAELTSGEAWLLIEQHEWTGTLEELERVLYDNWYLYQFPHVVEGRRFKAALDAASDAFFAKAVELYPEVKTGDVSPDWQDRWNTEVGGLLRVWLNTNKPK